MKLLSPWPIDAFNVYPTDHTSPFDALTSGLAKIPADSLGSSIPVFTPNPKYLAYLSNCSIPDLYPDS